MDIERRRERERKRDDLEQWEVKSVRETERGASIGNQRQ